MSFKNEKKLTNISERNIHRFLLNYCCSFVVQATGMMKDSHQPPSRDAEGPIDNRKWAENMTSVTIYSASPTNGHSLLEYTNLKTESGRHVKRVWSKQEGSEDEW